jgi:endo-1,4-beta-xylanase
LTLSRRALIGAGLALAACNGPQPSQAQDNGWRPDPRLMDNPPALKSLVRFGVGVAVQAGFLDDPAYAALVGRHFSQLTPEWELKMEYVVQPDGRFQFDRGDAIAAFARARGQRLWGHTLVWYAGIPTAFQQLDESRASFGQAFDNYITATVGRYRGVASGWDVINEPITDSGGRLRDCLWSQKLGQVDYMRRALDVAHAADPAVPLLINDYDLETKPEKLDAYLRLVDRLLSAGAPLGGLGCQSHISAGLPEGAMAATLGQLARFGLPIHVSELDVSLVAGRGAPANRAVAQARQAQVYRSVVDAFLSLPETQRLGLTLWGLRDSDSWLTREDASDAPLLFDAAGAPKPAFAAVAGALGS